jgi:hypothetical protein
VNTLWSLLKENWLTVILGIGALVSVRYVYKNKEKLMDSGDSKE